MDTIVAKDVGRMEIKIEQIDRLQAIAACTYCATRLPHLHYYVTARKKKYETYDDCLNDTRKSMTEWCNTCHENGFIQEFRSFGGHKSKAEFLAEDHIKTCTDRAWADDDATLSAESMQCHSLDDEHIINLCTDKNFRGFIKT